MRRPTASAVLPLALAFALLGCGDSGPSEVAPDADADESPTPETDRTPDDEEPDAGAPDEPFDAGEAPVDAVVARDVVAPLDLPAPRDVGFAVDVPAPPRDVGFAVDVPAPPRDAGSPALPAQTGLLLQGSSPLSCADPAVFSANNAEDRYFVYCTGMSHVWTTTDWARFDDRRFATTFDLGGMPANGRSIGAWWAPGVVYAPELRRYVMWVSVPDARATHTAAAGWDTRSLAVLTADAPTGPWTYRNLGLAATAAGQHFIDPFLFRDHDGRRYVFFKRYGGGVSSSIMGAALDASWQHITAGSQVEIMNGYGGAGTWEDNVRENPAVDYDPATGHHHMLFSGAHWDDDSYATGHSLSTCGPLCVRSGGWHFVASGDRGITQVVRANHDAHFSHGGPGGAVFQDDRARFIVYAAAARSARGDTARYLMRQAVRYRNDAPYVDTAGHHPEDP